MISVSSKHGLKALIALNKNVSQGVDRFVRVGELAREIKVPSPYLSKVAKALAKAALIDTRKGPGGGVRISSAGKRASFYDVCQALDDQIVKDSCFFSRSACSKTSPCPLHQEWSRARNETIRFLKRCLICEFEEFS